MLRYDMPRLDPYAPKGPRNAAWVGGRRVNKNGYVQVPAPAGHPHAKVLKGKNVGWIFEHRLVLEQKLGRYLQPHERVDHIDGLTLHNHPDNLRLFQTNKAHLQETLAGRTPHWSPEGYANMSLRHHRPEDLVPVDTHRQRTEAGATRLRQILLLMLSQGTDSPYLCGTKRWIEQAQIDTSSRSTIERALADLCRRWGFPPPQ